MGMYRDRKSRKFPCFYGNWCGPGCSGPEPPIDDVDAYAKSLTAALHLPSPFRPLKAWGFFIDNSSLMDE
ncbi:hypothetical protein EDM54_24940 [Brevibacillus borstelensis]|nr:hypothetical protein EDM54_24940 [Brevibacillus borstelensis]